MAGAWLCNTTVWYLQSKELSSVSHSLGKSFYSLLTSTFGKKWQWAVSCNLLFPLVTVLKGLCIKAGSTEAAIMFFSLQALSLAALTTSSQVFLNTTQSIFKFAHLMCWLLSLMQHGNLDWSYQLWPMQRYSAGVSSTGWGQNFCSVLERLTQPAEHEHNTIPGELHALLTLLPPVPLASTYRASLQLFHYGAVTSYLQNSDTFQGLMLY